MNSELRKFYKTSSHTNWGTADPKGDGTDPGTWTIDEVPQSEYTDTVKNSYKDYNDAAIVVFSRSCGEGADLPRSMDRFGGGQESYLELSKDEKDLLAAVKSAGFKKTIVILHSANPFQMDFLKDDYGIDSILWVAGTGAGDGGIKALCEILAGDISPSGKLVDTFCYDNFSSPAMQNFGDFRYVDESGNLTGYSYLNYAESIYVGYKYYETRYHDQILGLHDATGESGVFNSRNNRWNYADEVSYPFGYGTSYATFSQTLDSLEWNRETHEVTATVTVKNEGYPENSNYSGKSKTAIQLYVSLPWKEGQAEKSAIQLLDFGKSDLLSAGESKTYTLTADDYLFATYDKESANGADPEKKGCYVFDEGDYYFTIGKDAHDALNNVLAAKDSGLELTDPFGDIVKGNADNVEKITLSEKDDKTYATSRETGEVVSNQLEDIDINYFYDDDPVTYLTRADWNTFPINYDGLEMTDEIASQLEDDEYVKPADAPSYDSFTQGAPVTMTLVEMRDVPYEDEKWDKFIDQLSIQDMSNMIGESFGQPAIKDIGKNENKNSDGPAGPQSGYKGQTVSGTPTVRVNEVVAASTFNKDLLASRGSFIAEDCLFGGTTQLWCPGLNIHRTPFSGRNFEYFSEDSIMSYLCSIPQVSAMQAKGCNAAPKHFAGNDQETNRSGLAIYADEQAYRQGPLKGFEGAFTKGGALGTMMSCSRIGNRVHYYDYATNVQILRNEWGFKGITITDSVAGWGNDNPTLLSLFNGSDTFNARATCGTEVRTYLVSNRDGAMLEALRLANKHFFYAMSRSNIMSSPSIASSAWPRWAS